MYKAEGYKIFQNSTALTYCIRDEYGCMVADKILTEELANKMAVGLNIIENIKEEK